MNDHNPTFPTQGLENAEFEPTNPTSTPTMGELISRRFSRRGFLKGSLATTAIAATVSPLALLTAEKARAQEGSAFSFNEVTAGVDADHHVAEGYNADVLLRWGDAVTNGAPEFDPTAQTADAQAQQFGYNNDYVGYVPLEGSSEHGLLPI
jgi:secreted PhoX family phosphatase